MTNQLIPDLVERGDLTPAEAVDFVEAHLSSRSQHDWANERNVTQQAISKNINSAYEKLTEQACDTVSRGLDALQEAIAESTNTPVKQIIALRERNQLAVEVEPTRDLEREAGIQHPYGIFAHTPCNDEAPDDPREQRANEEALVDAMNERFSGSQFGGVQFDDVFVEKKTEGLPNNRDVVEFR
jgi:polyhydroxyalkanoate synthesis regulator phasin